MPKTDAPDTRTIPGLAARKSALKMLDAVLRRGEALDQCQHAATQGLKERADKALAVAIAAEALRWLVDLDALIDSATRLVLADDVKARMVLRLALVQALVLKTAPHAAIGTALHLVDGGPKRLVHGVFGSLLRDEVTLPDYPTLPAQTAARWHAAWGEDMVEAASVAYATAPPLDLVLRDAATTDEWAAKLGGTSLMPGHIRMDRAGAVDALEGYKAGVWWVQDLAASLPARLLGVGDGRSVLDLCAAPGGKTMQLASNGWQVTALDKSLKRLDRLSDNLVRTRLTATIRTGDALTWEPPEQDDAQYDAVLIDAPCSATGIFRRHPDVLHRVRDRHIGELADKQAAILHRSAAFVKPGGQMVYATCSLEPEEGEAQIAAFIAQHPDFSIGPVGTDELPVGVTPDAQGQVRTMPGMLAEAGGLDGFFMARLSRRSS